MGTCIQCYLDCDEVHESGFTCHAACLPICNLCGKPTRDDPYNGAQHDSCLAVHVKRIEEGICIKCGEKPATLMKCCDDCDYCTGEHKGYPGP